MYKCTGGPIELGSDPIGLVSTSGFVLLLIKLNLTHLSSFSKPCVCIMAGLVLGNHV